MAFRLYIQEKNGSAQVLNLTDSVIYIGRNADNEVVLRDQRSSRRHCSIRETSEGAVLEDLDSANGTLLNGVAVSRSFLAPGDEFRIGTTRLTYQPFPDGDGDAGASAELLARSSLSQVSDRDDGHGADSQTLVEEKGPSEPHTKSTVSLECVEGLLKGERFPIDNSPFVLGRRSSCDVSLPDRRVSSRHARIAGEGTRWTVEDLDSKNGILVNGRKVKKCELVTGTTVTLGGSVFVANVEGTTPMSAEPAAREPPGRSAASIGEDDLVPLQVDVEHLLAGERFQQPFIALGLVLIFGLLCYYTLDIARRLLIEERLDPRRAGNLITRNWSFEEERPRMELENDVAIEESTASPVYGWRLAARSEGKLEVTEQHAQDPGRRALALTSLASGDMCAAVTEEDLSLGRDRHFVLEGSVVSKDAFFAGYMVEWLRSTGDGPRVVGRSFSECTSASGTTVNVHRRLSAPANCTRARVSCVLFGRGRTAYFDRVSLEALPQSHMAPSGPDSGLEKVSRENLATFQVGDEKGLTVRLKSSGDYELATPRRRLFASIWAGLGPEKDPLDLGPRVAVPTVGSGDLGALVVSTDVPDTASERWVEITHDISTSHSGVSIRWRLVGQTSPESSDRLVIGCQSRDETLELVAHSSRGSRQMTLSNVEGSGYEEITLGTRDERTALEFSSPVSLSSRPHPTLERRWILQIEPDGKAKELRIGFHPGSQRENEAAIALLREASRRYQEGKIAQARRTLENIARLYPAQEGEIQQAGSLLSQWKKDAQRLVEGLEQAIQDVQENPSPVIYETVLARGNSWAERFRGTSDGKRIEELVSGLETYWSRRHVERLAAERIQLLRSAREHYERERYGLAELYVRLFMDSGKRKVQANEAQELLDRIRRQRERADSNLSSRSR